ncbi:unnamed protein product, partial [Didymodactylos carnosus]
SVQHIDFLNIDSYYGAHTFDVIIFCLYLDYLPSCRQRFQSCINAFNLLTCYGLLLIVEPDSNHQGKSHERLQAWKQCLEYLGFIRMKYEKLDHLHLMAFRKIHLHLPLDLDEKFEQMSQLLYIPQDFQNKREKPTPVVTERENITESFQELPFQSD